MSSENPGAEHSSAVSRARAEQERAVAATAAFDAESGKPQEKPRRHKKGKKA